MKLSRLLLIALVLILAGCASPHAASPAAALPASQTSTPVQTQTNIPKPAPSETATLALTPTATPSPQPTATPAPLSLKFDTAPAFQIIRDGSYTGGEGKRFSLAVSPETGQVAYAGCENGQSDFCTLSVFRLIDADTGQVIRELESLSPVIEVLKFSPDGRFLAAAGCNITLALYGQAETICDKPRAWLVDTTTGKLLFEMKGYSSNLTSLVFSPDGTSLFTSVIFSRNIGKGDYSIHIYTVPAGTLIATLDPPIQTDSRMLFTLDFSPDGRYLITDARGLGDSFYSSFVEWWDVQDPTQPHPVATVNYAYPHSLSPDSRQIIVQNPQDKSLHRYNLDSGALIGAITPPKQAGLHGFDRLLGFHYANDASTLLLDYGSELDIISVDSGEMVKSIQVDYVARYLFSPDRRLLLTSGYKNDGQGEDVSKIISVWDTSTWQEVPKMAYIPDDFSYAYLFAFNSDQTRLYVISDFETSKRIVTWGFPEATQKDAEKTLLQFFNLLADGSYAQAAGLTTWDQKAFADFLKKTLSLPAPADLTMGLQALCTDPAFPCRPVRDVLYHAQTAPGQYRFMVNFGAPDGSVAPWPPCENIPLSAYCFHRNSMFPYDVIQQADGSLLVSYGLPPSLLLHLK